MRLTPTAEPALFFRLAVGLRSGLTRSAGSFQGQASRCGLFDTRLLHGDSHRQRNDERNIRDLERLPQRCLGGRFLEREVAWLRTIVGDTDRWCDVRAPIGTRTIGADGLGGSFRVHQRRTLLLVPVSHVLFVQSFAQFGGLLPFGHQPFESLGIYFGLTEREFLIDVKSQFRSDLLFERGGMIVFAPFGRTF